MTANKKDIRAPAGKKDGDKLAAVPSCCNNSTAKYTFERSKEDISTIRKLRRILKDVYGNFRFNTDSEIYRDLPDLYFNAVKTIDDQQLDVLKDAFCRIMEICKEEA